MIPRRIRSARTASPVTISPPISLMTTSHSPQCVDDPQPHRSPPRQKPAGDADRKRQNQAKNQHRRGKIRFGNNPLSATLITGIAPNASNSPSTPPKSAIVSDSASTKNRTDRSE